MFFHIKGTGKKFSNNDEQKGRVIDEEEKHHKCAEGAIDQAEVMGLSGVY